MGPHAFAVIEDVEGVRHLAELGVVFLLFNIGLELSLERLRSMQKYVFGMGTSQVSPAWRGGRVPCHCERAIGVSALPRLMPRLAACKHPGCGAAARCPGEGSARPQHGLLAAHLVQGVPASGWQTGRR